MITEQEKDKNERHRETKINRRSERVFTCGKRQNKCRKGVFERSL